MKNLAIDLVTVNTLNPHTALKAMDYSCKNLEFNNSYIFTDKPIRSDKHEIIRINKFKSIDDYSNFVLNFENFQFKSDFILIIQDDGFVINPNKWSDSFYEYDFIGAPWPETDKISNVRFGKEEIIAKRKNRIGNGGFSLRSKKYLNYSSQFNNCRGYPEDLFLNALNYEKAKKKNLNFPPPEKAYKFSTETPFFGKSKNILLDSRYALGISSFGFHGKHHKKYISRIN